MKTLQIYVVENGQCILKEISVDNMSLSEVVQMVVNNGKPKGV